MSVVVARPVPVLLAYGFRTFFLFAGVYGALAMLAWAGFLFAGLPQPGGISPVQWHSHELLYGLVPAAIAGFLLTAISNWTGAPPIQGPGLLGLLLLWLAGRVAMWSGGLLPPLVIAVVDLAFLPALAGYVLVVLLRHGNHRNLIIAAVLLVLAFGNLCMHLGMAGHGQGWARAGELLGLNLITLLMVVIGGRIIPAFTANWLRARSQIPSVRLYPALERFVVPLTALMIPLDLLAVAYPGATAVLLAAAAALAAAVLHGFRLVAWGGWHTAREPLLWILHLGYAWIVAALLLKALAVLPSIPTTAWIHAMGAGAVGTLIVGVMTRVSAGHTGRPLRLVPYAVTLYVAITASALARLLVAFGVLGQQPGLLLAALAWSIAFGGFAALYWPVLSRPRVDNRPG
jgi:uncharacterized protein involved in response to NO